MKKLLLSLLCVLGFVVAQAEEAAFVAKDYASYDGTSATSIDTIANGDAGNIVGLSFSNGDITITHTKVSGSNSNVASKAVRWYQGDKLTFAPAAGVTISKIQFCIASGSKGMFTAETGTCTGTGTTAGEIATWEGSATDAFDLTAAKQVRFSYLVVTYSKGEITKISAPTFTPNGGEITSSTEISIDCTTEGASIYYTTDGTEPSATNGTLYSAPFTLSAAATVKAIAIDPTGTLSGSSVAEASFTFPVANIAEFIATANPYPTTISGTVTVVAQSGSYLFIQDETARIVAFGTQTNTYNNGDQLSNIKGTYTLYNGLHEMNIDASSFGAATAGTAVEPEVLTIEEVAIDNLLAYVKIEGVTIPESSSKNFTITDETGSIAMYNTLNITVPTGENLTVIGFISCYGTTIQIMPLEITSASGLEVIEAPVITPDGGEIAANQTIAISCLTEGASIYYTIDGTEPSATNGTLYSEPFTLSAAATVKAIAVKEGYENSVVVEAEFTLMSSNIKSGSFNFTDPSSLSPAQEAPAAGGNVVVNDITFTSGDISLVCTKGESASTDCRLFLSTSAGALVDLRTYSSSTITISGTNANILSIEFTGNKASATQLTADKGTFTEQTWTPTEATKSVVFTTTATTNIQTITVLYEADSSSIENLEEATIEENVPAEYYNLQGVKIAQPENGLYIRVQGNKATKVFVK